MLLKCDTCFCAFFVFHNLCAFESSVKSSAIAIIVAMTTILCCVHKFYLMVTGSFSFQSKSGARMNSVEMGTFGLNSIQYRFEHHPNVYWHDDATKLMINKHKLNAALWQQTAMATLLNPKQSSFSLLLSHAHNFQLWINFEFNYPTFPLLHLAFAA